MTSDPSQPKASFGQRVRRAASIDFVTFGVGQALRLGINVVLARLLFPEVFGLVASITAVNIGVQMLSDVGIGPALVQSEHGDDERYVNTAWTMCVIRGFLLWLVAVILAYPISILQDMPELMTLLPVGALAAVVGGFRSTSYFALQRSLTMRPLALLELGSQVISAAVMVTWAVLDPSPWALIAGGLSRGVVETVASHFLVPGTRNRLLLDRGHAMSIFHFGKWIVGSSGLSFLTGEGHKLALGRPLGTAGLGVYHMAEQLAGAMGQAVNRMVSRVVYPALCEVQREDPQTLGDKYYRARRAIDLLSMPLLGFMMGAGPVIVELLYGAPYADAGWMLQILCLRSAMATATTCSQYCLTALGLTRYSFFLNVGRGCWLFPGIALGYYFYGIPGVVWAVATTETPALAVVLLAMRKHGVLRIRAELLAPAAFAAAAGIALGVRSLLGL